MSGTHFTRALVVALALVASFQLGLNCNPPPFRVTIESPVHGSFTENADVVVSGTVRFGASPTDVVLTLNGVVVPIAGDKTWSASLPLDAVSVYNPVLAEMVNLVNGRVARDRIVVGRGASVADGDLSFESVALRLNDFGLDAIEPVIADAIDFDPATLFTPGEVLIDECLIPDPLFGGCLGSARVQLANPPPEISGFGIDTDSQPGSIAGNITVTGLRIDVDVDGSGLVPNCGLRLTANSSALNGSYALEPDAGAPTQVDVTQVGSINVSFAGFNSSFTSGLCDAPIIGDIIDLIIGDVEPLVRDGLAGFLNATDGNGNTPVAAAIEGALTGIEIAGPIGDALGLALDAPLFQVAEDVEGMTLGSDSAFTASVGGGTGQCTPPPGSPDILETYSPDETFPAFATCQGGSNPGAACTSDAGCSGGGTCRALTPDLGSPYGLGICVSTAAFNQLLKALIECGLLNLDLLELDLGFGSAPITAQLLSIVDPVFAQLVPSTPYRIELRPTLAPVLTGEPGPEGEIAELRIAQLAARLVQDDGSEFLALELVFDAAVGLDLRFESGQLLFDFGDSPVDPANIRIVVLDNAIGANANNIENGVLPFLLSALLPDLASGLGSFPLPDFFGLSLQGVEVSRQGEFFSIFSDLVPVP